MRSAGSGRLDGHPERSRRYPDLGIMDDDIEAQTIWLLESMHLGGGGEFGMPGLPPDMSVKIDNVGRLGRWPTGGGHTVELRFSWRCPRRRTVPVTKIFVLKPLGGMYIVRVSLQRGCDGMRRRRCPWCQAKIAHARLSFSLSFPPLSFSFPLLFRFLSFVIITPVHQHRMGPQK